jgi:RNase P/RNase MRP subunit POP5
LPRYVRRRYVAVRVESNQTFSERDVYDAVWTSLVRLFGEYGASQSGLFLVEYKPEKRQAVFRCSHRALEMVKASIAATTEVTTEKAAFHIIRVSGTLKSLRTKIANR